MRDGPGTRLRRARRACGFSQQQVASRAGISRQAISAIETGVSDPSLRVAFTLAQALEMTVGDLFGTGNPAAPVRPVAAGGAGTRVTLAAMGTGYVALPLRGAAAAPAGSSGLTAGTGPGRRRAGKTVRPRPGQVAAGCDPALPLLAAPLGLLARRSGHLVAVSH